MNMVNFWWKEVNILFSFLFTLRVYSVNSHICHHDIEHTQAPKMNIRSGSSYWPRFIICALTVFLHRELMLYFHLFSIYSLPSNKRTGQSTRESSCPYPVGSQSKKSFTLFPTGISFKHFANQDALIHLNFFSNHKNITHTYPIGPLYMKVKCTHLTQYAA